MDGREPVYLHQRPCPCINSAKDCAFSPLYVRPNLVTALRHLRNPAQSRRVSVDALSINQQDLAERSEQVKRMGLISSLAHRVVAWLGLDGKDSKHAISTLRYLGDQIEISNDDSIFAFNTAKEPLWMNRNQALPYDEKTWQALIALYGREWFSRLWVTQEILLANRNAVMLCGFDELQHRHYRRATAALYKKAGVPPALIKPVNEAAGALYTTEQEPLMNLLESSFWLLCSDPKDKIYGILSLCPPHFVGQLRPDYSTPVSQVYKEAFLAYVGSTNRLDLLAFCDSVESTFGGPS